MTLRGYKLGFDSVRLPISAYSNLVATSRECQFIIGLCHLDVCPDNIFALEIEQSRQYFILLSDWGSLMTFEEVAAAEKFHTM